MFVYALQIPKKRASRLLCSGRYLRRGSQEQGEAAALQQTGLGDSSTYRFRYLSDGRLVAQN